MSDHEALLVAAFFFGMVCLGPLLVVAMACLWDLWKYGR